jgi:hypothetical protein
MSSRPFGERRALVPHRLDQVGVLGGAQISGGGIDIDSPDDLSVGVDRLSVDDPYPFEPPTPSQAPDAVDSRDERLDLGLDQLGLLRVTQAFGFLDRQQDLVGLILDRAQVGDLGAQQPLRVFCARPKCHQPFHRQ